MAIILGDDFNATFTRMAESRLAQNDLRAGDAGHEAALRDIQKTLRGDKVHITEQRASGPLGGAAQFVVLPTHTIGTTGIELYGVCLTDEAGVAALQAQGLIDATAPVYDRLGTARSEAVARNMTQSHDQFSVYMKDCAARAEAPDVTLHDRVTDAAASATAPVRAEARASAPRAQAL